MENNLRHLPRNGEVYKYFEGGLYTIIAVAKNIDTAEILIVYKDLYDVQDIVYAQPLSKFMAVVDIMEYPNSNQKYKYEFVRGGYGK